jgi:hypothetical protein
VKENAGEFTTAFRTVVGGQPPSASLRDTACHERAKWREYWPVVTTLSSLFGRFAHART